MTAETARSWEEEHAGKASWLHLTAWVRGHAGRRVGTAEVGRGRKRSKTRKVSSDNEF